MALIWRKPLARRLKIMEKTKQKLHLDMKRIKRSMDKTKGNASFYLIIQEILVPYSILEFSKNHMR